MLNRLTLAVVAVLTLGASPALAAEQVVIPPTAANFDVGVSTIQAQPNLTPREHARLTQITQEYQVRVDAAKDKLGKMMREYRDMQAHNAPVPAQIKKREEIIKLGEEVKAANKAAWAKAARLLQGKITLVNQGGGGGTIVVPGGDRVVPAPSPKQKK
jgi:hypothetical protein